MRYSDLKSTIVAQFLAPNGNEVVPFIEGRPGGGKSACAREIALTLKEHFNIADEQIVEFNPSLRDPVDILGIPFKSADGTHNQWLPPEEFYNLREGVGPCVLIIEELSDAPMAMQNPMCRVILDRCAGSMKLSSQLFIIATGNRVEDRSGANRMSTKLGNRLRCLGFDENLDDWVDWAKRKQLDPLLVGFIRFRPNLLSDFDPKRKTNPTPRAWEKVAYTPQFADDPNGMLYMMHIAGDVGEGAASEYVGFRKIYHALPDFDAVLKEPKKYTPPTDASVSYAVILKLCSIAAEPKTTQKQVDGILEVLLKFSPELIGMAVRELTTGPGKGKVIMSKGFVKLTSYLGVHA